MARLIWTDPALLDLDEIAEYIALDKPAAAAKLVLRVFDRLDRLGLHPQSGRRLPELPKSPYREVIVGPCRVFYRAEKNLVYILHVMRGERELREYLLSHRDPEA